MKKVEQARVAARYNGQVDDAPSHPSGWNSGGGGLQAFYTRGSTSGAGGFGLQTPAVIHGRIPENGIGRNSICCLRTSYENSKEG